MEGGYRVVRNILDRPTYYTGTVSTEGWVYDSGLVNTGYDTANTLRVSYSDAENRMDFYINNTSVSTVSVSWISGQGAQPRFMACISGSAQENFPEVPADIRYNVLTSN